MTGIIVSDTSPLRALAHLGRLEWLEQLFGEVVVPTAVALELSHPPARFEPLDLARFAFIRVRPALNLTRVAYWR